MIAALKWVAIAFAALVVALLVFLALFDWNHLRGPVAQLISKNLDREVRIDGELEAHLFSSTPRFHIGGLKIAQPSWAGEGDMLTVDRVAVEVELLPLLTGHLTLPRVEIEKPELRLLRKSSGQANWQFGTARPVKSEPADLPVIHRFTLREGRMEISDEVRKLRFTGTVAAHESLGSDAAWPFRLEGRGMLNDKPFNLAMRGGPLVNVRRNKPYPFDAQLRAGDTRLGAQGSIAKPFNLGQLQADLSATGNDLADLYYLTGLALPNTPPYKVSGRLRRDGMQFRIADFSGKVGDSDVNGVLSIDVAGERPRLQAELASRSLDLDDLAAPFGAPPSAKPGETVSPVQKAMAQKMAAQRRLFPDASLQLDRVRGMDAELEFRAHAVKAHKIPLRQVAFHLKLDHGVLAVDRASFEFPQGKLTGNARVDATKDVPETKVDLRLSRIQLGQFRPRNSQQPPLEGTLQGRIALHGRGDSVHKVVSSADGTATVIVPQGELREVFAELTGINVARGLGLLLTKDQKQIGVRCGVADFQLDDGSLTARNIVFDTENVLITGEGKIELDSETVDMKIKGQPKKLRLLRVKAPISIKGPLRKPEIGIEGEKTVKQGAVAAALSALVAPLAAVIAFVDPGLAKDADCAALLAEGKEKVAPPAQAAGR